MNAHQIVNELLSGAAAKDWIKNRFTPEMWLHRSGFELEHRHGIHHYRKFSRPESMPTPYAWGDLVLDVYYSKATDRKRWPVFELGVHTMGQFLADYPDIWLGQFSYHTIVEAARRAVDVLQDREGLTYDELDSRLRAAVGKPTAEL